MIHHPFLLCLRSGCCFPLVDAQRKAEGTEGGGDEPSHMEKQVKEDNGTMSNNFDHPTNPSSSTHITAESDLPSSPEPIMPITLLSDDEEDDAGFDLRPLDPEQFQITSIFPGEDSGSHQQVHRSSGISSRRDTLDSVGGGMDGDGGEMIGGIQILPSPSISIQRPSSGSSSTYPSNSSVGTSGFSGRIPLGGSIYLDPLGDPSSNIYSSTMSMSSQPGSSRGSSTSSNVSGGNSNAAAVGNEDNRCDICNKTFTLRTNLTAHKRLHFGETGCPFCEKILSTVGNLRMHIINVHNGNALCPPRRSYVKRQGY